MYNELEKYCNVVCSYSFQTCSLVREPELYKGGIIITEGEWNMSGLMHYKV